MKKPGLELLFLDVYSRFEPEFAIEKLNILSKILQGSLKSNSMLAELHDALLFTCAYPQSEESLELAQLNVQKIANYLKSIAQKNKQDLTDTGLPYTRTTARFTPDMLSILMLDAHCEVSLDSFEEDGRELCSILETTLPSIEREKAAVSMENLAFLQFLGVPKKYALHFILEEFAKINYNPWTKDLLWNELKAFVNIDFLHPNFSRSFNYLSFSKKTIHPRLEKKIDAAAVIALELPKPKKLSSAQLQECILVIRRAMVLTMRETDTSTFMQENTLQFYELERGISVAIYGMVPERQLPLQSYIGYTLFKNGIPAAYGGAWVWGDYAQFGLNILDAFRGGESAWIMAQLLRVYKHVFNLKRIEVEAYQIGKDNEDGINSGAYWFYYRFGFRSIEKAKAKKADEEWKKIQAQKEYRSAKKTLQYLAESNILLGVNSKKSPHIESDITAIQEMIVNNFRGSRVKAVQAAKHFWTHTLRLQWNAIADFNNAQEEWALWALCNVKLAKKSVSKLEKIVKLKVQNPYLYNPLLTTIWQ